MKTYLNSLALLLLSATVWVACKANTTATPICTTCDAGNGGQLETGADQLPELIKWLNERHYKKIALVVNQTSRVGDKHLIDSLIALKTDLKIVRIFAPEHGFRGEAGAGEKVADDKDAKTGLPIVSLYGKNKKPTAEQLADVDAVIYDIQDVGARFYTYISTMTYVMEACAAHNKAFVVLDRPNPAPHVIDGPVLEKAFSSFVGMHQVPILYGMTAGEYARMVNGEAWLDKKAKCDLTVMSCKHYSHKDYYTLPVAPSPNLKCMESIYCYGFACLFEGTAASEGRGTEKPFCRFGYEGFEGDYTFTPQANAGSKSPKLMGKTCGGYDLSTLPMDDLKKQGVELKYLLALYKAYPDKTKFFNADGFFDKLAGTKTLRTQIMDGKSEEAIRQSWQADLTHFKAIRQKYLLYADF